MESLTRFSAAELIDIYARLPLATAIYTTENIIIEHANDAMLSFWGKDKSAIGKPLMVAVPELEGQPFKTLLQNVWNTGITNAGQGIAAELIIEGSLQTFYYDYEYSAILDEKGKTKCILHTAKDVTEQVRSKKEIEEKENRLRFTLDAIPQQVWTARTDGTLDYVNQVVCKDFGYGMEYIIDEGWQTFIHPDDLKVCLTRWTKALKTGNEYTAEFRLLFNDGSYQWHLARALPLVEEGQIRSWLGTNTNIELQKQNEQKKDEFLSIASHELKTPLTSIKAFNQLMIRTAGSGPLATYIKKSSEQIVRLEKLIGDLLDVTKINAGKMRYTMETFSFSKMLTESIETAQHASGTHQIILESLADVDYLGDRFRLEQVLHNFLSNAVKYSPGKHQIIVNSKVEYGSIIVSIHDFGIGIAEESMDKLFDRYYRIDNKGMRFEGLGLGLFISSEILKEHQGSFWIESELGAGSVFSFRLPLHNQSDNIPISNLDDFYQDNSITITYDKNLKRLDVNWTGFQDFNSVQAGCKQLLLFVKRHHCGKILNDNRQVLGTWSEAAEWVGEYFFPILGQAGGQFIAWVFSQSAFSKLSAKKTLSVAPGIINVQFFTDMSAAENWINKL